MPIECAQGDRPARCPNHFFAVNEPSAVPWWWCDLFWCHEVACGVRWSNVHGREVTWGELLWLVAMWHVMSCHLMCWSCHLMRCDCLCGVMSRDAMRSHVMCAHVKSCHLLCPAMGWNVMSLKRYFSLNNHSVLQSTTPVLLCTTKYYNILLQYAIPVLLQYYYSVLQSTSRVLKSTTPVLPSTTEYYSNTTLYYKVLLQYYSVLPSLLQVLLQYYSVPQSNSLYYKVLLQYYSVLQSTSPYYKVLLPYYSVLQVTTVSVSFWMMQFQSLKCKCWNLFQLSLQGYILGRFLLSFSQCNSRVSDGIHARCLEASLSRQNSFSSLIELSSCLIWLLLKLLTCSLWIVQ